MLFKLLHDIFISYNFVFFQYIKISIEPKWIEHSYGKNINSSLNEQKLKYEIRNKFGFGIISWERDIQQLITSENDLVSNLILFK